MTTTEKLLALMSKLLTLKQINQYLYSMNSVILMRHEFIFFIEGY